LRLLKVSGCPSSTPVRSARPASSTDLDEMSGERIDKVGRIYLLISAVGSPGFEALKSPLISLLMAGYSCYRGVLIKIHR
jgi:hypothetical protein